jgi:hypothetical protein
MATAKLVPRYGPRLLVTGGMSIATVAMLLLTQLGVDSTYAADVLPGLLLIGVGMGLVFAPAMSGATLGVDAADAGVASAMVNTSQQVGGSIGTALLSTLASSAAGDFAATHAAGPATLQAAAVHGYTTAFWWAAGIFAVGAVVSAAVFRRGVPHTVHPTAEPVLAH